MLEGKSKLVLRCPGKWELHNLEADRTEMNSVARPERRMSLLWMQNASAFK